MNSEVTVGTVATVKVGKNEVEVSVVAITANGWMVKSTKSGKEFEAKKLEHIISVPEPVTPHPAPTKLVTLRKSLLDAAYEILSIFCKPLNCKEMVTKSIELGLWLPTSCKTPEQTLYGSIFREIKEKENPRFRKSTTRKGSFEAVK